MNNTNKIKNKIENTIKDKTNKKRNKCAYKNCNKKLQLFEKEITCKCEQNFCFIHRMPLAHICTYDYNNEEEQIREKKIIEDMRCVADKVVRI